jgi:pimeloyl-ACP methyl ester carboxylesterase
MIENTITLPDGRLLGYGLYGNPLGIPILDFHGIPGSRREAELIASYIKRDDLCFIGFDRPGYGRSTPKRNYKINDLPADVAVLADYLKINRFIALGYSGGGPFALACAAQMPERLGAVGIVSGVGPSEIGSEGMHESNKRKFNLAQRLPGLARMMLTAGFSAMRRHPDEIGLKLESVWRQMPEADQIVLQDKFFAEGITEITLDAIRQTVRGWVDEEILMSKPWQFNLTEIKAANLFLWHGGLDRNVPISMAKAVSERIPGCRASFFPEEGHLSLLYNHGEEIISTLVKAAGY